MPQSMPDYAQRAMRLLREAGAYGVNTGASLWNNRGRGIQYFRDHPFQVTLTIGGLVAGYAIGNIADVDTKYAEAQFNLFDAGGSGIGAIAGNLSGRVVDHDVTKP